MIQIVEGHPGTGLLYNIFFIIIKRINIKDIRENKTPKNVEIDNGIVEKLTIASMEYLNNPQNDQLVSPIALSTFSYSIHLVLNPTHSNNPFEKHHIHFFL